MKIYNSLTNKKEPFKPIIEGKVSMYVCGPTVYNYIHIGNARPVVVFDTLRRLFEHLNYEVTFISNYTDVDDKIINAAIENSVSENEITTKFIKAFEQDRDSLNVLKPTYNPKVTDYMDDIINFISLLVKKDLAYVVDGDVYVRINKLDNYGILNNFDKDNLQVGARISANTSKENPLDFTLWKKTEVGINWDSPFSKGRPGWHTECVVMIDSLNNHQMIDIHGGGMDLKFPHHENEIAQAKACYNHNIANYWMHNGFINLDDEKMSKSIGNVLWAKDVISEVGSNVFRLALLSSHYRSPLNFNDDLVTTTQKELDKIENVLKQTNLLLSINNINISDFDNDLPNEFISILSDDLNTSGAISIIFKTIKVLNQLLRINDKNFILINKILNSLIKMLDILGIMIPTRKLSSDDINLYNEWLDYKDNKDFINADIIRTKLINRGII